MASVGPAALPRSAGSSASSLPFVNALSCYLHGSIAREDSERKLRACLLASLARLLPDLLHRHPGRAHALT